VGVCSEEEDDEYSDDDDMSWKVRRASAKCLTVILGSRVEMLMDFYHMVSPTLIARFKGQQCSHPVTFLGSHVGIEEGELGCVCNPGFIRLVSFSQQAALDFTPPSPTLN